MLYRTLRPQRRDAGAQPLGERFAMRLADHVAVVAGHDVPFQAACGDAVPGERRFGLLRGRLAGLEEGNAAGVEPRRVAATAWPLSVMI